jgi:hypothetical protein
MDGWISHCLGNHQEACDWGTDSTDLVDIKWMLWKCEGKWTKKSSVFWDITQCSPLKVSWRFGGTSGLHLRTEEYVTQEKNEAGSKPISALLAACVMVVGFQRSVRRYIREDRTLHIHSCEDLRSHRTEQVHDRVQWLNFVSLVPEIRFLPTSGADTTFKHCKIRTANEVSLPCIEM